MHHHFNRAIKTLLGTLLFLSIATVASAAAAAWTNGQPAQIVLGQIGFSSNSTGMTAAKMNYVQGVGVDPTTGKLFVADSLNHRVLRFASDAARVSGSSAEAVLGQANLTSGAANRGLANPGPNTMNRPYGLFVDSGGRLWVADSYNNRVLRFDHAASKANGANADGVLGQADYIHGTANRGGAVAANTFNSPTGLFIDSAGRLWVADEQNNRVLRFDTAASKLNGAAADRVLGQADHTHNVPATSQSGMQNPNGVTVSSAGTLFVADWQNNRVLRFNSAASKLNGANADGVLGQADYTHNMVGTTQSRFKYPTQVTLDSDGRLYVADSSNSRVMIFNNAESKTNGAAADNVLGQANFTTDTPNAGGTSARTLNNPRQVFYDNVLDVLWVADRGNNRVLRYASVSFTVDLPLIMRR